MPSTTIGELDVKNDGHDPLKSSLRHSFLPFLASRQESMPRTPNVTTLPSATTGEARGPGNPWAAPVAGSAAYSSFHTSSPLLAFRHRVTSLPSSTSREKTYSLSPTSAGVETPSPTLTFHFCVSALGQAFGALKPVALASRFGPRHCGQSCAAAPPTQRSIAQPRITPTTRNVFAMFASDEFLPRGQRRELSSPRETPAG